MHTEYNKSRADCASHRWTEWN